jgi:hypothetical protein
VGFHKKYFEKGLTIAAITRGSRAQIEKFAKEKGINYPVGLDTGEVFQAFGIRGIPHGYIVDPKGKVIWEGHPGNAGAVEAKIEEGLKTARVPPALDLSKSFRSVEKALKAEKYGSAAKYLRKILKKPRTDEDKENAEKLRDFITNLGDDLFAEAEELAGEQGYYEAEKILKEIKKKFSGLDIAKKAKEKLKEFGKDGKIKKEIKAGQLLEKAGMAETIKQYKAAYVLYKKIGKSYKDTKAAEIAKERAESLVSRGLLK